MPRLNLTVSSGRHGFSVTGKIGHIDLHLMTHNDGTVTVWAGKDFKVSWSKETFKKFVEAVNYVTIP